MRARPQAPIHRRLTKIFWQLSKGLFALILLAFGGLYGYVRYDYNSAAGELDGLMDRAKELGLPLTPEDMARRPAVAASENAAPLYRKAFAEFEQLEKPKTGASDSDAFTAAKRPGKENLVFAKEAISGVSPAINAAFEAAQKPHCDFARDWSRGPMLLFPEFATQKSAAKWLAARGEVDARQGNPDRALSDLRAAFQVATHSGEDKCLIGGLVEIAIDAIAVNGLETVASYQADNPEFLSKMRSMIVSLPKPGEFKEFLKGEVFYNFNTTRHIYAYSKEIEKQQADNPEGSYGLGLSNWMVNPPLIGHDLVERAYASKVLDYWVKQFEMCEREQWNARVIAANMDLSAMQFEHSYQPSEIILRILLPVFSQAGQAFEKQKVNRTCARAMVDVLLYKNQQGHFPKTLEAAGIHETDPFDNGKPLKYRLTKTGFRIYSVGFDHKDDGGLFGWERPSSRGLGPEPRDEPIAAYPAWERLSPKRKEPAKMGRPMAVAPAPSMPTMYQ